jgi:hypothetical protein
MALLPLKFRPGINKDQTNYAGEGGWFDCDKIRFRSGFPQKIGGWVKSTPNTFLGVCRQLWNWVTSFQDNLLAVGTHRKVYIEVNGAFYDITPYAQTFSSTDTDNCIETDNGSNIITVNLIAHTVTPGSFVTISGVVGPVGGVPASEINGNHEVTVVSSDVFTFDVATTATATVSAGGGTDIEVGVEIAPGNPFTILGYGWGTDTWGRLEWGLGGSQPVFLQQRDWWFDNFDNDLVMNFRNGPIYYWERGTLTNSDLALSTRAVTLASLAPADGYDADAVPVLAMQTLVSQNDKHLLAFGAVPFGSTNPEDFDPLLIRWADQDNPTQWTPTPTNSAGFLRISRGNRIVRALPTRQEILVWTDSNLYTLQFLGTTDVFSLQEYADNISIISPRAVTSASNVVYWMGKEKFYAYTGRVETLPCTVREYVFQDINQNQTDQIVCGTNEEWNEVWWFYPSAESNWNDRYVIYNHLEQVWYFGNLSRTAWLDTPIREFPIAVATGSAGVVGTLYNHENGVDDDGEAMESFIQSNDFDLGEGDKLMLSRRILPDVRFAGSTPPQEGTAPSVDFVIRARNFPGSGFGPNQQAAGATTTTCTICSFTQQVFLRTRGRQLSMRLESDELGTQWQLGVPRLDVREDGLR